MDTFNQGKKMKRTISAIALARMMSVSMAASATDLAEDGSISRPTVWAMGLDAGLVRPVGLAATVIGVGLFIVTLPFSALGGNVGESAERLVVDPAKMTFLRCLGCTEGQNNETRSANASHDSSTQ